MKGILARRAKTTDMPEIIDTIKRRAGLYPGRLPRHDAQERDLQLLSHRHLHREGRQHARILDVKYYVLLPAVSAVGSSWTTSSGESILRSVSAHRSYGWVYDAELRPANIADFLIGKRPHAALAGLLLRQARLQSRLSRARIRRAHRGPPRPPSRRSACCAASRSRKSWIRATTNISRSSSARTIASAGKSQMVTGSINELQGA